MQIISLHFSSVIADVYSDNVYLPTQKPHTYSPGNSNSNLTWNDDCISKGNRLIIIMNGKINNYICCKMFQYSYQEAKQSTVCD